MDLYNIPGDTGHPWRLKKFVEYQHEVPSIHYRVMGEYIKKYVSNKDDAVMMCWYMSATYNEVTCVLLNEIFNWHDLTPRELGSYCQRFWEEFKPVLNFGSSRKYAKNMDWFPSLMKEFIKKTKKHPYDWLISLQTKEPLEAYKKIYKEITQIHFTGRFAADLFMESIMYLQEYFDMSLEEPSKLDWPNCSNLTSGVLNICYLDEEANSYDKTGKLPEGITEQFLTKRLNQIQRAIQKEYPEQDSDINLFVGKICSFRNLFKSARYGGFHHDRELGVLRWYQQNMPQYDNLWNRIFKLRRKMFHPRFLGELNGWDGIRPERKKLWLKEGKTGVELDS